ncbi:MAG: hypothetical protein BJ554DRAFT_1872, partial [Olpidium bornovanus]
LERESSVFGASSFPTTARAHTPRSSILTALDELKLSGRAVAAQRVLAAFPNGADRLTFGNLRRVTFANRNEKRTGKDLEKPGWACVHGREYQDDREYFTGATRGRKTAHGRVRMPLGRYASATNGTIADDVTPGVEYTVEVVVPKHDHDSAADVSAYPAVRKLSDKQNRRYRSLPRRHLTPMMTTMTTNMLCLHTAVPPALTSTFLRRRFCHAG